MADAEYVTGQAKQLINGFEQTIGDLGISGQRAAQARSNALRNPFKVAGARAGGDIKFKSFNNGVVTVELQGSCSGCPSSLMTLKQGVQNLLCHYVEEVKSVEAN